MKKFCIDCKRYSPETHPNNCHILAFRHVSHVNKEIIWYEDLNYYPATQRNINYNCKFYINKIEQIKRCKKRSACWMKYYKRKGVK